MNLNSVINKLHRELKKKCGDYWDKEAIDRWIHNDSDGTVNYSTSFDDQDFDFWFNELYWEWKEDVDEPHNAHKWIDAI